MPLTLTMDEACNRLSDLPEQFAQSPEMGTLAITQHGKPVLAVMSWELYESLIETMEILSDPELMANIRQGIREIEEGKGIPFEQVKQELGL
ncbi:MAG: type II toxin-antitoxin system Phd/YefM family antitoxin [Acidobacteria bacterium]|nr:type II toxin-antitoxin system Phd/YefM family antitoxin [Acidobacteriota bacterium]